MPVVSSFLLEPFPGNLFDLIGRSVRQQPDHVAVGSSDLKTIITYGQLDSLVQSTRILLASRKIARGDTVVLVSDNSVEFVVGFLAVIALGAKVVPLSSSLTPQEYAARLAALNVVGVLIASHLADHFPSNDPFLASVTKWTIQVQGTGADTNVSVSDVSGEESTREHGTTQPSEVIQGEDIALIMFTAGSTSAPKAAPLTHVNLIESVRHIAQGYELSTQDATLLVMPLFHGHGLVGGLLATLASGGSAYLPSTGAFSAHLFWPDAVRIGMTWYTGVPTIHRILVNRAKQEYPGNTTIALRFIRSCSAPLDDELVEAVAAAFHAPVISAYGMTETAHQVSSNPLPSAGVNKTSTVGLPTGVEVKILHDDGAVAAVGEIGEVVVRGRSLTAGYLNNPEANATSFLAGWFHTGDLGSIDEDGYLNLKGRLKELINRGGDKVSPHDVDAVLVSHPKVLDAATFGEPDPVYGEVVQAAVSLREGETATESELREFCSSRLSAFEVPQRIFMVSGFPKTAKGSIDRRALARQFDKSG
jgi:acyl-CoA synthetase (AMP-forming)/AMP-acid ligase II